MKNPIPQAESGKTIMELMIVLTVIIILVTIAVSQFGSAGTNFDRQNIAREFKVSLERARFDSVKRRATACDHMSRVTITSASSFTLLTDLNQNGTIETGNEARVIDFENRSDVRIVGENTIFLSRSASINEAMFRQDHVRPPSMKRQRLFFVILRVRWRRRPGEFQHYIRFAYWYCCDDVRRHGRSDLFKPDGNKCQQ
jgi:Tfp pilus assembly protein FimT